MSDNKWDNTLLSAGAVEAVERLTKAAAGKLVEIDGREYSTTPLHDPREQDPEPLPELLAPESMEIAEMYGEAFARGFCRYLTSEDGQIAVEQLGAWLERGRARASREAEDD